MRQEIYNKETLIQYLLGSLPAEEVELFDELSIADDEFANSLNVAEDDLVDAYVRGELAGSALAAFRSSYLTSAKNHEKVRFAQSLQDFCERSSAVELDNSAMHLSSAVSTKQDHWLIGRLNVPRVMKWGIAAVTLVLIAFAWLAYHNLRNTDGRVAPESNEVAANTGQQATQRAAPEPAAQEVSEEKNELTKTDQKNRKQSKARQVAVASFVLTPQMRGAGQLPAFVIPATAEFVTMQLQLEPNDYSIYRVALLNESSQVLWRSQKIKAREKTLSVTFPASLLTPSIFVLQIYGIETDRSETLSAYPFKVE
jgi:hypothetical protein